jgi:hypothetical protein
VTDRHNPLVIGEHRPWPKPPCQELTPLTRLPVAWPSIGKSSHVGGGRRYQEGQICATRQRWLKVIARSTGHLKGSVRALENRATQVGRRRAYAGSTRLGGISDNGMQLVGQRIGNVGRWDHGRAVLTHRDHSRRRFLVTPTGVASPQDTDLDEQEFEIALAVRTCAHGTNFMARAQPVVDPLRIASVEMVPTGDGVRLQTWTSGTVRDSAPVLLIHGGPGMWDYLEPVADMLAPITMVHRFDQRGCGGSDPSEKHTIARYMADIDALRGHWEHERWIVMGQAGPPGPQEPAVPDIIASTRGSGREHWRT